MNIYKDNPCSTCPYNHERCDIEDIWKSCSLITDWAQESHNHKLLMIKAREAKAKEKIMESEHYN